jgi:ferredoxin-type protein NapH
MASMIADKWQRRVWQLARWRFWVQASFTLVWLDPLELRFLGVCSPVFHCYSCPLATFACPIGVLANFSALHVFPFLAVGTLAIVGTMFGTVVCGWACPFGFLQDLVARIPTPKFRIPGWMGYTRYGVLLGLVLAIPFFFGESHLLFICRLCPAGALEAAVPYSIQQSIAGKTLLWPSATKTVILLAFVLAMLFTWRPWCTIFCPLGAVYSLFNNFSLLFLRFQPKLCNDCELCRDLCKYHGPSERRGSDMRCIRCLECVNCKAISVDTVFHQLENLHQENTESNDQA